jgi:hypothetical protein
MPIHRVVLVLEQIRARLACQTIGMGMSCHGRLTFL